MADGAQLIEEFERLSRLIYILMGLQGALFIATYGWLVARLYRGRERFKLLRTYPVSARFRFSVRSEDEWRDDAREEDLPILRTQRTFLAKTLGILAVGHLLMLGVGFPRGVALDRIVEIGNQAAELNEEPPNSR